MRYLKAGRKPRTRKDMIAWLRGHFRYDTMNSWNAATSYAMCVKVHRLDLPREVTNACYEALDIENVHSRSGFNRILYEFDEKHGHEWQIRSNGRSGGYLVLYQGGMEPSGYKSHCTICGQENFELATNESKRCGRCGKDTRVNYDRPPMRIFSHPGRGLDMHEDGIFEEWTTDDLRSRVDLVWEFDAYCRKACEAFIQYALKFKPVQKTVMVPKNITVPQRRAS